MQYGYKYQYNYNYKYKSCFEHTKVIHAAKLYVTNTSGKTNTYTDNKSCVEHDIVMRAAQHLGWGAAQSSLTNTTFLLQEIALTQHHQ